LDTIKVQELPFTIGNRKYLGSKKSIKTWIMDTIINSSGIPSSFLDGFCGTGTVSGEALSRGTENITAVDNLRVNTTILQAFYHCRTNEREIDELIAYLNSLKPYSGYITGHFADTYFTEDNCRLMDAVRDEIENLFRAGEINSGLHTYLKASFVLSADRVANTIGQYDAYLKHIGSPVVENGKHLVDLRVYSPFRLKKLKRLPSDNIKIINGDMVELADKISLEVAYYDPPYNKRQYFSNYHLLENLTLWEKPQVFGKTKKYRDKELLSRFSKSREVRGAFNELIGKTNAARIFISYNSEGLLKLNELKRITEDYGRVETFEYSYRIFGNGAGVSLKRPVTEYLIKIEKF